MTGLTTIWAAVRTAWSIPSLRRLLFGYLCFATTEWAAWVAILLEAHDEGGAEAVAAIAVAQLVPAILIAPFGASLADRLPRLLAVTVSYLILAATMGGLAVSLILEAPLPVFVALAIASNCAVTLCRPAHFAALPKVAPGPAELVAANAASSTMESLGVFVGPALVAVLVASANVTAVFVACGAVLALSAVWIGFTRLDEGEIEPVAQEPILEGAWRGVQQVRAIPGAGALLLLVGVQFVVLGALDVLGVVFPIEELQAPESTAGLIIGASGVGGLIGAAATVLLIGRPHLATVLLASAVCTGAPLALVAGAAAVPPVMVLVAVSGVARSFFDVAGRTILQRTVPERALARVFGLQESALMGGLAIGAAITPLLLNQFGPRGSFVVIGLLPILATLAVFRSLRRLDRIGEADPRVAELLAVPMLSLLPGPALERLARATRTRQMEAGEAVFSQGDIGDDFYLVLDGHVDVVRDGERVARLGPGGHFGEVALLRAQPRNATVRAVEPTSLLRLAGPDFLAAVTGSRPAAMAADRIADARS